MFRPALHFTARKGWINDPNGLIFHRGLWHLYYQHNPFGASWGHIHWGHAVSKDLVQWKDAPLALHEDAEGWMAFSGSVVACDALAAEGNRLAAFYTRHPPSEEQDEQVHLAFSTDSGFHFQAASENPILVPPPGTLKFGDPKVWRDSVSKYWCMINIAGWPDQGHIVFAKSNNLIDWQITSEFHADVPGVWECPDIVLLPVEGLNRTLHLIKINTMDIAANHKATKYFVGHFDGDTFYRSDTLRILPDPIPENDPSYAEMSWSNTPDGCSLWTAWLRQSSDCDRRDWTGALSLPRILTSRIEADGIRLLHNPAPHLAAARGAPQRFSAEHEFGHCEIDMEIPALPAQLRFLTKNGLYASLDVESTRARLSPPGFQGSWVDFSEFKMPLRLRLWLDGCCASLFLGDGVFAPSLILESDEFSGSIVFSPPCSKSQGTVWEIHVPSP